MAKITVITDTGMAMDDICRLCMSNTQCDKLKIPLFLEQSPEFVHNLVTLLGFPINVDDGLPSHICIACSEAAMKAHKFRTKCIQSNDLLWERLRRVNESLLLPNEQNCDSSYKDEPEDDFEVQEAEDIETIIKREYETRADCIERAETTHKVEEIEIKNTSFLCHVCVYGTNSKRDFNTHYRKNHLNSWQCSKCDYRTNIKSEQRKHQKTHPEDNPFLSKMRLTKFRRLDILARMLTQSLEKRYKCRVCHRHFRLASHLKSHMVTHSQERPFQCKKCQSKFKEMRVLKRHMITHSQERPFQCKLCPSKFKESRVLKQHMSVHSPEKPFQCNVCLSEFKLLIALKQHKLTHSEKLVCNFCMFTTKNKKILINHIDAHAMK